MLPIIGIINSNFLLCSFSPVHKRGRKRRGMELRNRSGLDCADSKENFLVLTLSERRIWKQIHEVLQRESKTCQRGVAAFLTTRGSAGKCLPVAGGRHFPTAKILSFFSSSMSVILQRAGGFGKEKGWSSISLWPEGEQILSLL